jgi:L-asparaginase
MISVFTTGGTIDKVYFDALSQYQVGESVVCRLLSLANVKYPFDVVEALRKDSLELTDEDREELCRCVVGLKTSRIVVTHGTDTMTLTARRFASIQGKTIVLTGALTPARFSESDASFNLGMAFATVCSRIGCRVACTLQRPKRAHPGALALSKLRRRAISSRCDRRVAPLASAACMSARAVVFASGNALAP